MSPTAAGSYIAGICVGALPVAKSGVLAGRKATTYHLSDGARQRSALRWVTESGKI